MPLGPVDEMPSWMTNKPQGVEHIGSSAVLGDGNMDYLTGMRNAAEIAARQAADDGIAANATTDLDSRMQYLAQQERALAIQKAILKAIDETKVIIYKCPCGVEHINRIGAWGFRDGEPYPIAGECEKCGGPVFHRPGKPGEYDHECKSPNAPHEPPRLVTHANQKLYE